MAKPISGAGWGFLALFVIFGGGVGAAIGWGIIGGAGGAIIGGIVGAVGGFLSWLSDWLF